jgi:hypothetical protein
LGYVHDDHPEDKDDLDDAKGFGGEPGCVSSERDDQAGYVVSMRWCIGKPKVDLLSGKSQDHHDWVSAYVYRANRGKTHKGPSFAGIFERFPDKASQHPAPVYEYDPS